MDDKRQRVPLETRKLDSAQDAGTAGPLDPETLARLDMIEDVREKVVEVLQTVYDPEIPVNVYELGLVYGIDVNPDGAVAIKMTLTSPACPVAGSLPPEVEAKVKAIPGVTAAKVELVWDPPWDMNRMSESARLQLGFF